MWLTLLLDRGSLFILRDVTVRTPVFIPISDLDILLPLPALMTVVNVPIVVPPSDTIGNPGRDFYPLKIHFGGLTLKEIIRTTRSAIRANIQTIGAFLGLPGVNHSRLALMAPVKIDFLVVFLAARKKTLETRMRARIRLCWEKDMSTPFADNEAIETDSLVDLINKLVVNLIRKHAGICFGQYRIPKDFQDMRKLILPPVGILLHACNETHITLAYGASLSGQDIGMISKSGCAISLVISTIIQDSFYETGFVVLLGIVKRIGLRGPQESRVIVAFETWSEQFKKSVPNTVLYDILFHSGILPYLC